MRNTARPNSRRSCDASKTNDGNRGQRSRPSGVVLAPVVKRRKQRAVDEPAHGLAPRLPVFADGCGRRRGRSGSAGRSRCRRRPGNDRTRRSPRKRELPIVLPSPPRPSNAANSTLSPASSIPLRRASGSAALHLFGRRAVQFRAQACHHHVTRAESALLTDQARSPIKGRKPGQGRSFGSKTWPGRTRFGVCPNEIRG